MSDDKIAEIRARYAGYSLNSGNAGKANEDRGWLLAEVERHRAENEKLRAEVQRQTRHVEQIYDQIRRRADERDKAQIEVKRLRAEIERLREVIRTIRARCVELDDSDAVSETLDIATAVLEDEPCA